MWCLNIHSDGSCVYVLGTNGWFAKLSSNEICESRRNKGVSKSTIARGETVWLTQAQLCELYQSNKANVSEHIKNIFEESELEEASTVRNFRTVQIEGGRTVNRSLTYYNLDMIISLGYRIKSSIATQ